MDFGLAKIVRDPKSEASASKNHGHTPRWTAPEIFLYGTSPTRESDMFSFAMVIYEVRRSIFDASTFSSVDLGFLWESPIP